MKPLRAVARLACADPQAHGRGPEGFEKPWRRRAAGRQVYVGNLVAGLVTEDALRTLFNTTMQVRRAGLG